MENKTAKDLVAENRKLYIENRKLFDEVLSLRSALQAIKDKEDNSGVSLGVHGDNLVITIKTGNADLKEIVSKLTQHAVG